MQCREFLRPAPLLFRYNPVRFKKYGKAIIPHRKPRWIPMARSKMFKDPPVCLIPQEELDHEQTLHTEYNMRMKALVKYLDEDYLKFSDVGEAGRIEAELELKEHTRLLQENDEDNERVAELRRQRLIREAEETRTRIATELQEAARMEEERIAAANEYIETQSIHIKARILPDQLEEAILEALDNPIDNEFALDVKGNIFRGRQTKSLKVAADKYENVLAEQKAEELILTAEN
eukprot:TRINITY_DN15659_c0_g1_i1.p1 TRINITY_DN15659_c0_g1~~TRINITY_DN15659_c0_g1_i1.p1  ORF type:complete len:234 (-),score=35.91 TRINITY_DN15659_c0_g1_i1:228-929(-)